MKNLFLLLLTLFSFSCSGGQSDLNIAKKAKAAATERKFVIVVASYNNARYFQKNLDSIFSQKYNNYHVIYTNDASTDTTYEKVRAYVDKNNLHEKITLIHNESNRGALYNYYAMIQACDDSDIIVMLDGDDWFSHFKVLKDLNLYYENSDVWMTYGQFLWYPKNKRGNCRAISKSRLIEANFRDNEWIFSHLRSFYAGLFKKIKLEDLLFQGKFFPTTYDLAIMYPMIEMAREHTFFIPDVMYVYNFDTPINDERIRRNEQVMFEKYIRSLPMYDELLSHPGKKSL